MPLVMLGPGDQSLGEAYLSALINSVWMEIFNAWLLPPKRCSSRVSFNQPIALPS
jgi:hypothetical protein